MKPERIEVSASGMRFGALGWGSPDQPLALLLHGFPDTAWTWRELGPRLAERGWRAVAPFMRGYAPSDLAPDGSYLIADLARDALELHTALGGDDRAALIGHDWGAAAAYTVTEIEPQRFGSYVIASVPPSRAWVELPRTRRDVLIATRQVRASWYFLFNQLPGAERSFGRLIPKLWRDWSPGYDASEDVARLFEALPDRARRRAALGPYRQNLRKGLGTTLRLRPRVPVLYLHGRDDGSAMVEIAEASEPAFPAGSRLEMIDGAGHFPQLERPEDVSRLIAGWLTER